jgi:Endonuclease/Exonuclease/phosphatase family
MSRNFLRPATSAVAVAVAAATFLAAPATSAAAQLPSARGNPTGTLAGSRANGTAYLGLSLASTRDGRLRIRWRAPGGSVRRYVVRVGPNRLLDSRVRRYKVRAGRTSIVVPRAFGAFMTSGNFSFVKVSVVRPGGTVGSSPTKWIQAPLAAGCPSTNRVTVGTFNVRTWHHDSAIPSSFRWGIRGPRAVTEIIRSGAHAVAIQEASGLPSQRGGGLRQTTWLLRYLNSLDPDRSARWVDALPLDAYRGGLIGTRVFYDASKYDKLAAGYHSIGVPGTAITFTPWARLRARDGRSAPFVLVSTHLTDGERASVVVRRNRQAEQVAGVVQSLRRRFGGQVILAGDLNSTVNTKPYNTVQYALLRRGFYDSFASARIVRSRFGTTNNFSFPVRATPHRRDYILTYGGTKGSCGYVNRAYTRASQTASDHFMQVATVPVSG